MRFSIGLMTLGQNTDLVTVSVYVFRSDSTLWTMYGFCYDMRVFDLFLLIILCLALCDNIAVGGELSNVLNHRRHGFQHRLCPQTTSPSNSNPPLNPCSFPLVTDRTCQLDWPTPKTPGHGSPSMTANVTAACVCAQTRVCSFAQLEMSYNLDTAVDTWSLFVCYIILQSMTIITEPAQHHACPT
jgi:hypothetical protein